MGPKEDHRGRKRSKKNSSSASDQVASNPLFFEQTVQMTVSILPTHLGNKEEAIHEAVARSLLTFVPSLGGILMAFHNLHVLDNRIVNELPYIHYQVQMDATTFCPTPQAYFPNAIVQEQFATHWVLLLFGYFNASIPASELYKANLEWNPMSECWQTVTEDGEEEGVENGYKVGFTINKVMESAGLVSIDGIKPDLLK